MNYSFLSRSVNIHLHSIRGFDIPTRLFNSGPSHLNKFLKFMGLDLGLQMESLSLSLSLSLFNRKVRKTLLLGL
jgi:hypothetical protein